MEIEDGQNKEYHRDSSMNIIYTIHRENTTKTTQSNATTSPSQGYFMASVSVRVFQSVCLFFFCDFYVNTQHTAAIPKQFN